MATLTTFVTVPPRVLFRDLGEEAVILELESGRYYGLNEVATRMWLRLLHHGRVASACQDLLEEYEVAEGRLRKELLGFVDALAAQGLLQLHDAP